ncbi:hypothetical protein Droror1_Dr00001188 [Drosera rotundifolia]
MASPDEDYSWSSLDNDLDDEYFEKMVVETGATYPRRRYRKQLTNSSCVPRETRDIWDKLFKEGYGADVFFITESEETIAAHSNVLSIASDVLHDLLEQSRPMKGIRYIRISVVPRGAMYAFIRFLYSSCYEEEEMKKFVLHLLVLSHSYHVPSLKRVCVQYLEQGWLNNENVVDILQLARICNSPRLFFICVRMIIREFKAVASTEGWKVMRSVDPALEQELLEAVVEADSRKEERLRKREEKKVYLQLHEALEALLHICKEGCRTIGPCDKTLKANQFTCRFPACKGVEMLVRHFFSCKARVPGGCTQCKRMWQLLELHSCVCSEPDSCKVPLCRQFKEKRRQRSKKEEARWKLLVSKVMAAKGMRIPSWRDRQVH